jgi:hypothetical protein
MILFLVSTCAVVTSPPSMLLFSGFCVVFLFCILMWFLQFLYNLFE